MKNKLISSILVIMLFAVHINVFANNRDDAGVQRDVEKYGVLSTGLPVGSYASGQYFVQYPGHENSRDYAHTPQYVDAGKAQPVVLPVAGLKISITRADGTALPPVVTRNLELAANSAQVTMADVEPLTEGPNKGGYANGAMRVGEEYGNLLTLYPGDTVRIEDDSISSGMGNTGNPDNTAKQYDLQVEGSSTAASQFSRRAQVNGSGSAIRSGWLSPVEFTVTTAMAGELTLYYGVSDWEKVNNVQSDNLSWYEADGEYSTRGSNPVTNTTGGVFSPYYYTKMPMSAGDPRYGPGGFGGYRNWSQNGSQVAMVGEVEGAAPYGAWMYKVAVQFNISAPTIDVVKVYQNEGPPYIADVVTEKSTDNPYTIPAGGGDFKVTEWKQIREPKPASIVDNN